MTETAEGARRTALVTDAGRGSALCIIRSLGRQGWRVVAADASATSPGFRSRYATETFVYPDPRASPTDFAAAVLAGARRHGADLVIPATDDALHPLSMARDDFLGVAHLAIAAPQALARVSSKQRTLELARELGVPTPRTVLVGNVAEAARVVADLAWPVVIKPEASRHHEIESDRLDACAVSYARNEEELLAEVGRVGGRYRVLLQEYCHGDGVGVELLALEGRPLLAFQHRRLAEVPMTGGASAWRESVALDPALYDHSLRLVEALGWTGLLMVEFKQGERSVLMEINGRVWGSLPLAVQSGLDFPARWAELCMNPESAPSGPLPAYPVGVRAYNLDHLLLWIGNVLLGRRRFRFLPTPRRRAALRALAALLSPSQHWDFTARDDPGPARAELRQLPLRFARRVLGARATLRARFWRRRSAEERLLLACCRQRLTARDRDTIAAAAAAIRWDRVLATAERHQIAPLVLENLRQCRDVFADLPRDVVQGFERAKEHARKEKLECAAALERAIDRFRELGTDVMLLKGAALDQRIYDEPWYTSTSDVDLCLRASAEDLDPEARKTIAELRGSRPPIDVHPRMHPDLLLDGLLPVDVERVWRHARAVEISAEPARIGFLMDREDQLLFACVDSGAKRFFRLKSLCGIGELVRREPGLDWDEFARRARADGSTAIVYAALLAASVATGCPAPDALAERLTVSRLRASLIRFLVVHVSFGSLEALHERRAGLRKLLDPRRLLLAASLSARQLARAAAR